MAAVTEQSLMEVCEKLFAEIDINKNGKLEKSEVRSFTEQTMKHIKPGQPFDEAEFESNFAKMDKNADGTVSKQELFDSLKAKAVEAGCLAEGQ